MSELSLIDEILKTKALHYYETDLRMPEATPPRIKSERSKRAWLKLASCFESETSAVYKTKQILRFKDLKTSAALPYVRTKEVLLTSARVFGHGAAFVELNRYILISQMADSAWSRDCSNMSRDWVTLTPCIDFEFFIFSQNSINWMLDMHGILQ